MTVLEISNIKRTYHQGNNAIRVLRGATARIEPGEIVGLLGPSGCGKSTLLHIAGLLEQPDSGEVTINGRGCRKLDDQARTQIRRDTLGFVYQFHHLLPEFTALENVAIPQRIQGIGKAASLAAAAEVLTELGLKSRLNHRPAELSGGEQQRVALARAVVNQPKILLADEPTGNLDEKTADTVFNVLIDLVRGRRLGALIATHNMELASRMDRCLYLHDGELSEHA